MLDVLHILRLWLTKEWIIMKTEFPLLWSMMIKETERGTKCWKSHFPSVINWKWFPKVCFCISSIFVSQTNPIIGFSNISSIQQPLSTLCFVCWYWSSHFSSLLNLFHLTMNLPLNKLLSHKFSAWLLWCKADKILLCWTQLYLACVNNAHPFQMENHFISLWGNFSSSHT